MSADPTNTPNTFALGRRGFLGAAAALGGTAALAPMASAAPLDRPADKPDPGKPVPIDPLPPSAVSLVPISDGNVTAAIARLDGIIKDVIQRTGVPGLAAAVVHNGQVKFLEGYGVADKTLGNKVTPDTVFQLASVSKPLAASAVARAIGRAVAPKVVDWTDPIVKHIPGFALADPYVTANVTIQDMLSHRSGLPGAAGDLLEDLGYEQSHVLTQLRLDPLNPMRTIYNYANFGFTAGAIAASNAMRQPWAEFADATLFGPLGMTQSSYRHSDFVKRSSHSAMHVRVDGVWKQLYVRNADPEAPAGGASSSVVDLAKWLTMELANGMWNGQQFIDAKALGRTHQPAILLSPPAIPYARSSFYGLGWDISDDAAGRVRWSHSGAFFQGASTQVLMLPSANLGIVVLTNGMPIGVPGGHRRLLPGLRGGRQGHPRLADRLRGPVRAADAEHQCAGTTGQAPGQPHPGEGELLLHRHLPERVLRPGHHRRAGRAAPPAHRAGGQERLRHDPLGRQRLLVLPHRRERARHHGRDVRAQHREPGDEPHPRVLQRPGSRSLHAVVVGICTKCNVALSVVACLPT